MDLIENSVHAHASLVDIRIEIDKKLNWICVEVEDDGKGLQTSPEQMLDPFYTTGRSKKVGLGLSLFKAAAESAGGQMTLSRSEELGGMLVRVTMRLTHVDRVPFGDLATTVSTMIFANPFIDFHLNLDSYDRSFHFKLSQFAQERRLRADSNVDLASAAHDFLRGKLEAWEKSEMSGLMAHWTPAKREYQSAEISQQAQGASV
jgi:hypothetical protein